MDGSRTAAPVERAAVAGDQGDGQGSKRAGAPFAISCENALIEIVFGLDAVGMNTMPSCGRRRASPSTSVHPEDCRVHSTATRESREDSFEEFSRLPLSSGRECVRPVMFPPGCARLATDRPAPDRERPANTMGIVCRRLLAAREGLEPREDHIDVQTHQLVGQVLQPVTSFSANRHSIVDVPPST